ncbi:MAG: hypothetical protein EA398_00305 [Deltaproteobacteria bacterium]|nr:MAG: hypothetical protein EA398_00305 [Deltaproteobacteria bacterium]
MARQRADFDWRGFGRIFLIVGLLLGAWTIFPATVCTFKGIDEDVSLDELARTRPIADPDSGERHTDLTRVSSSAGFFGAMRTSFSICFGMTECPQDRDLHRSCAEAAPIAEQEDWKRYGASGAFVLWILFGFGARMQMRRDARRLANR